MNVGSQREWPERGGGAQKPVPREHGAWGLLLQPFVAAAILAWRWDAQLIPAFLLVLLGFLIREPLTILARRFWAGHTAAEHTRSATEWLITEIAGILISFGIAVRSLPWKPLCLLIVAGLVLTLVSVWFALKNRQRSISLQIVAVGGLGSSALMGALAATREVPLWAWLLWTIVVLHGVVAVLSVHARLEMRIAAARSTVADPRGPATIATILQFISAFPLGLYAGWPLAIPIVFSSAIHGIELGRLASPQNIRERLQRVGFRTLAVSLAHTILTVIVLWPLVRR